MIKLYTIRSGYISAKKFLSEAYKEAREYEKQNNVYQDIEELIKSVRKKKPATDNVSTSGINDKETKTIVDTSKSGLEAYAKMYNLNITFHTPEKSNKEVMAFEKPLAVTVTHNNKNGMDYMKTNVIEGDPESITTYNTEKYIKRDNNTYVAKSSQEENLLNRIYRTVSTLKDNVEAKLNEDHNMV